MSESTTGALVLGEPSRTAYDLNFRVFDFPVRVSPWFWLAAIILGQSAASGGIATLAPWMAAVFVSILIHELGHAFAFRHFGIASHLVLYHFGGLAVPDSYGGSWGSRSIDARAQAMISAAGPFAQIVAGVLVIGLVGITGHGFGFLDEAGRAWTSSFGFFGKILPIPNGELFGSNILNHFLLDFVYVSLFWAVFNLLPVFPLDGGQITRNLLIAGGANQAIQTSLMISVCTGAAMALYGVRIGQLYFTLLFGMLAYSSFQALNQGGGFGGGGFGSGGGYGRRGW